MSIILHHYNNNKKKSVRIFILVETFMACSLQFAQAQVSYTTHLQEKIAGKGSVTLNQPIAIEQLVNNTTPAPISKSNSKTNNKTGNEETTTHSNSPSTPTEKNSTNPTRTYTTRTRHKTRGFRICIFTGGNSRSDKTKATQMGQKCRNYFPELAVYTSFIAPRWVTYVGDFRTRQDAQKYVKRIRHAKFTYEVRIVGCEVNLPNEI